MKNLITNIKNKWNNLAVVRYIKRELKYRKRLKELAKQDPFTYK